MILERNQGEIIFNRFLTGFVVRNSVENRLKSLRGPRLRGESFNRTVRRSLTVTRVIFLTGTTVRLSPEPTGRFSRGTGKKAVMFPEIKF